MTSRIIYWTKKNTTTTVKEEVNRIHVSLLTSSGDSINENSYAYELAELSGGIVYSLENNPTPTPLVMTRDLNENTAEVTQTSKTGDNLTEILGEGNKGNYTIITSTGLINRAKLNSQLNKSGSTDTDIDGLSDWDEVNTELIGKYLEDKGKENMTTISNTDLPLFSDLILHSIEWESFKPYLWTAEDFRKYAYMNCFDNVRILPILSDPFDGDNDVVIDKYDENALKYYNNNDDILNDYNNALVTFELEKSNYIQLTRGIVDFNLCQIIVLKH